LYQNVSAAFLEDFGGLLEGLASWESELTAFKAKAWVFRQNRDMRFSASKAPYKTNLAAFFSVGGGKSHGPGYYLHIQLGLGVVFHSAFLFIEFVIRLARPFNRIRYSFLPLPLKMAYCVKHSMVKRPIFGCSRNYTQCGKYLGTIEKHPAALISS
jgi:hypothetical protein